MDPLLWLTLCAVLTVLLFDYTNGFHDAANVVATVIASRAMSPAMAVSVVGVFEFLGPLLGGILMPWLTQYMQFLQEYRFVVFGPLLILLVIFVPHGIVGSYLVRKARRASESESQAAAAPESGKAQETPRA